MRKRLWFFLTCLMLSAGMAFAQKVVTGTVIDLNTGEPLVGVHVKVNGQALAITDATGKFTLNNVPESAKTIEFSYMGYEDAMSAVKSNIRIAMAPAVSDLDEVMIVAYGTQKKASFTGAATTVDGEQLEKLQVSNLGKALEGAAAGVQIASASGTPGSGASIRIRGLGSISASQEPLIVIDGVPYEMSLNSIPTQDIETMQILKDAAANSMYGARGSNGVIMITTKSGKTGKVNINFDARYGFNARGVGNYDIITNPGEYYEMMFESYRNSLINDMGYAGASQYAAQNLISKKLKYNAFKGVADNELINPLTGKLNPNARQLKWGDDWTKDPFENGTREEYNVNFSGGTENTKAFASLGYLKDEGYMVGSGFDRYNSRVKVDQVINKNVRVGGNIAYSHTNFRTFGDESTNYSNIFMFSQAIAPIYPIYLYKEDGSLWLDENGNRQFDYGTEYGRPYAPEENPVATAIANIQQNERDNFSSRGYFEWTFLNDFKFTANVAYDVYNGWYKELMNPFGGSAKNVGGRGYKEVYRNGALNVNQLLDWNHEFGLHGVHVLLGHENKNDHYNYFYGQMTQYSDPTNPEFSNAAQYQDMTSYTSEYALEGYFIKGEYSYADKYYFMTSLRRDGSSRFHPDNRWGTFWAIGGAWRLNEESFMKDINWVNSLKAKISYGTQGNDNVGLAHVYSDLYRVDRVDGAAAFSKVLRGNPDLSWEKSRNFNAGIEAGLWHRLNFNFEFFIKETRDMLYQSPLAASEGKPTYIWKNEMNMKNTGIEIEINGDIIKTKDIVWNAALNLTHYKNKLTKLPSSKPATDYPNGYQAGYYWRKLGGSLYDWYRYEYVGVDPENGLPMYNHYTYKRDEEGKIMRDGKGNEIVESIEIVNNTSEATLRQTGKSAIPDLTGGLSTSVSAYGFDLSIATAFQFGGWVRDNQYAGLMNSGANGGDNFHKDMFDRWTPSHTNTYVPRLDLESQSAGIDAASDFFLTKASYFSLRNITLGYTFPKKWILPAGISNLRVYLTGDNIWMKSKRKGLDPRQYFNGDMSYGSYSALSSYSIGLNLSF